MGAQKLTKGTECYQKLKKMFEDKLIKASDMPKDVWSSDDVFTDYTLQQFRSQFNKLKAVHGTNSREGKLCRIGLKLSVIFYSH
jgi:hypothetical protein